MTLQADVGLQQASKLEEASRSFETFGKSLRLKDDVTCKPSERSPPFKHQQRPSRRQTDVHKAFAGGVGLPFIFFFFGPLDAWQLKFRAGATRLIKYLRCPKPKPAKSFHSAMSSRRLHNHRQKTLRPRWSTSQSLKRDSDPQKKPKKTDTPAAQLGLPGRSPGLRNTSNSGFARIQLQFCLTAALQRQLPRAQHDAAPKLLEQGQGRSRRDSVAWAHGLKSGPKNGPSYGPKIGATNGPSSCNTIWN